jgi:hypothetical protein
MKTMATVLAFTLTGFFALSTAWAQAYGDKEHAELAKALKDAKVSLQHGLTASAKEGKPISAKYEMEDGKLQLSVYTMKGDKFSEVIVDHKTGKVAKTEAITQATISRMPKLRAKPWPRPSAPSMRRPLRR